MNIRALVGALLIVADYAQGQQLLDQTEDLLRLNSRDGLFAAQLTGLLDLEGYYVDQRPPGLLYEDESFFNPRLSWFVDMTLGSHFYGF
jgi:hypothetical protein